GAVHPRADVPRGENPAADRRCPSAFVSAAAAPAPVEARISARRAEARNTRRHRSMVSAILLRAWRLQMARWVFHGALLPADDAAPETLVCVQRHRCALRVSGRLRGNAAGALAARP